MSLNTLFRIFTRNMFSIKVQFNTDKLKSKYSMKQNMKMYHSMFLWKIRTYEESNHPELWETTLKNKNLCRLISKILGSYMQVFTVTSTAKMKASIVWWQPRKKVKQQSRARVFVEIGKPCIHSPIGERSMLWNKLDVEAVLCFECGGLVLWREFWYVL